MSRRFPPYAWGLLAVAVVAVVAVCLVSGVKSESKRPDAMRSRMAFLEDLKLLRVQPCKSELELYKGRDSVSYWMLRRPDGGETADAVGNVSAVVLSMADRLAARQGGAAVSLPVAKAYAAAGYCDEGNR